MIKVKKHDEPLSLEDDNSVYLIQFNSILSLSLSLSSFFFNFFSYCFFRQRGWRPVQVPQELLVEVL